MFPRFRRRTRYERSFALTLSHDGTRWRATGTAGCFTAPTLREVEEQISRALLEPQAAVAVLSFDVDNLPGWMRQYQAHYFNYRLKPASRTGDSA